MIQGASFLIGTPALAGAASALHDFFTDVNMALEHVANGLDDFVGIFLLHNVAVPTGPQHSGGIDRLIVHGDNEQLDSAIDGSNLLDQFEAAFSRQADIHQYEVRLGSGDGWESLIDGAGSAAHGQMRFTV